MRPEAYALAGLTRTLRGDALPEAVALRYLRQACEVAMKRVVFPSRQPQIGEDVVSDAWIRLSRAKFEGHSEQEAWSYLMRTVRRVSMQHGKRLWGSAGSFSGSAKSDGSDSSGAASWIVFMESVDMGRSEAADMEGRQLLMRMEHLRQVLVLLAGRSQRCAAVRAFLDYCLDRSEPLITPDRTVANRLAKRRERGRDYARALVAEHPDYFLPGDEEILTRLLGDELLSAEANADRPVQEDDQ